MIITETVTIRDILFVHTYSDAGYRIRQGGTGAIYDDAYDPAGSGRAYTETDIPIEGENEEVSDIIEELKGRW